MMPTADSTPQPEPSPMPDPSPLPSPSPDPQPFPDPNPDPGPMPRPGPAPMPDPTPLPPPSPVPTPAPEPAPGPEPRSHDSSTVRGVDAPRWPELFAELTDATAALRTFLQETAHDQLDAHELRMLERLVEAFQEADQAVSTYVEGIVKRSTGRPRR